MAVNFPLKKSVLTYVENEKLGKLIPGQLIQVPLGRRLEKGVVLKEGLSKEELKGNIEGIKFKTVHSILTEDIFVEQNELELLQWTSQYYHYSLGKLIFDCLPDLSNKFKIPKGLKGQGKNLEFDLNVNQQIVINEILSAQKKGHNRYLVHGITGSGKTAIYLEIIKNVLNDQKSVLFLLPEINLTPQFLKIFEQYIAFQTYPYHSNIKKSDKLGIWKLLQKDTTPKIIVGTRSSIFLPIKNLGLIIVDEEHDQSFKQDDRCPYNAKDLAIKKSILYNIPIILGSATPSLESVWFHRKKMSENNLLKNYFLLNERIGDSLLPEIEVIDTRGKWSENSLIWPLTEKSFESIKMTLGKNEQVLVFINRLGFANYIQCRACGAKFNCINCSSSLKYYKKRGHLSCQFCDYSIDLPESCIHCGCLNLIQKGFGTEKIVELLSGLLPEYKIDRFDREEIKTMKQLEEKLKKFHNHEINILVGTQMLSKGHNFKKVSLVLILGIDSQLNYPDFRSDEKVFQLLTQVSGRSGRFGGKSLVIIQTMNPEHEIFSCIKGKKFIQFYDKELEIRNICKYPPYSRLAVIYIISRSFERGVEISEKSKEILLYLNKNHFKNVAISGPRTSIIEKRVNQYTWCILLKSYEINELHNIIHSFENNFQCPSGVQVKIDIDPYVFQ